MDTDTFNENTELREDIGLFKAALMDARARIDQALIEDTVRKRMRWATKEAENDRNNDAT